MISGKFSFILFNLISFCTVCFSQSTVLVGAKTVRLLDVLEATHFLDLPSDSLNTSEIIGNFMGKLDPKSLIFLREDERQLLQYSDSLRIDFKQYSETLVTKTSKLYKKRLLNADSLISALAYQSFNFYEKEILNIDYEHGNNFASTQDSLTVEWGKVLKARILNELIFTAPDSIKELKTQKETLLANLQEVQAKVEKKSKYLLSKILNHPEGFETYIETAWLNAVCSMFDPHTVWFTPDQKNQFQESLSAENYGFGINFTDNDDGNIVVDGLSFGSPAWLEKDIETGDIIIGVKPIDKDYIDLTILDSEALAEIINHTSHNRIEFTFRNKNNQNIVKQISKSKIESENIVRSFVLKGSRNIGYVYIPSFYTGFGFSMNNGCSHSVLREMVKLENEGVEGILLDLRGNTGGSLIEAIEIASIFLRDKSIAKLSQRNQPDIFLRTSSQIINCDLPLVILADASSASASELLAGSLEIYNRAIIVGQNTFGKFTGQVILPLNVGMANTSRFNDFSEYGLVKVTTEKTYLANGICYQGHGITPHIQLPFLVDDDQYRVSIR
jgi:carboxyl-terminal processing protease